MQAGSDVFLACSSCGSTFPLGPQLHGCPNCSSALQVRYENVEGTGYDRSRPGIWKWRGLLPPVSEENIVSMEEGGTPLIRLRTFNGPAALYLKNETGNPTWSWKDRAASVSTTMARTFGYPRTVAISTGNLGNSVSAYSARAGLGCTIFCNPGAPDLQLALMRHYGAQVFRGGDANSLVNQLVERGGWYPATIIDPRDGFANPYGVEGFKTIAFEIHEQLGGRVPDRVFVPAGSGDGLFGIWKGFDELYRHGLAATRPKMIACQADGADAYVRAFRARAQKLTALPSVSTVALSIAEKIGGELTLRCLYDSDGNAVALSDETILATVGALGGEGLALEPASAASVAGATQLAEEGNRDEIWVAIGTGAAVKWPPDITRGFLMPDALADDFTDLNALIPV